MKQISSFVLMLFISISLKAQTVDYNFITSIVLQADDSAIQALKAAGYTENKGEFRFIADNLIKSLIVFVQANPKTGQDHTYWAFQARGKKVYKPIFKQIKKGATVKTGTHFGKPKTEYKSADGIYFYPFEDSMFDGLYWIYASKESLLE